MEVKKDYSSEPRIERVSGHMEGIPADFDYKRTTYEGRKTAWFEGSEQSVNCY